MFIKPSLCIIQGFIPEYYKLFLVECVTFVSTDEKELDQDYPNLVYIKGDNLKSLKYISYKVKPVNKLVTKPKTKKRKREQHTKTLSQRPCGQEQKQQEQKQ